MADGILGGHVSALDVRETLYTVASGVKSVFRVHCSNISGADAEIQIYLNGGAGDLLTTIATIANGSTLVIPNLVLSAGQILKVEANANNVTFVANGIEELV